MNDRGHSKAVRLVEIAGLLGVTKQRAHQIAEEKGFPAPLAEDARGRVWSRNEVQAWAKLWRLEKPGARMGIPGAVRCLANSAAVPSP